jgi:colanic acid biosynthesis glycosyl transferase WcaI
MRILVVSQFFPPEGGAAAARLHGLGRWLTQSGHQVTVITGFPNYPSGIVPGEYRGKWWARERLDGMEVVRGWVFASPRRTSACRLANYFSYVVAASIAGMAVRGPFDVVLASSPPLFVGLAGWLVARARRIPWVFDIRDLWPEVAVEAGEFSADGTITRLVARLSAFLYRRASHLTPVTENKRKKLAGAGVPPAKMTVVTNGVDLDLVRIEVNRNKREELGLKDKFVVLYAGLIGIAQGLENAVEAADRLRAHPEVHFLIVGDGVRRQALRDKVNKLGLENVTLLPQQPRDQVPALMAAAEVCLVPLVSSRIDDAVPSKLLEAWAYERAVILAAAGEAAELVSRSGGGIAVPPEEPGRLADAVLAFKSDPGRLRECARRGREFVQQHFDRRKLALQMEEVLRGVVNDHRQE